jgi:hypothetical protein
MTTFGSMFVAGNEAVQSSTTSANMKKYYWEIYHLMGDPSIMTYLTKPSQMTAILPSKLLLGESALSAKVAPYSYCALTDSTGELVSVGFADADGNITLHFEPLEESGEYEFAAWAQKYIQYFKTICVGPQDVCAHNQTIPCLIYPNPANTNLMIETENQIASYEIIDMHGKVIVSKKNVNNSSAMVNVASLAAGVYFIKVIDSTQKVVVRKFVKQ